VYSGLTNPPFTEDQIGTANTSHFRSCYIEAKRCGEAICNAYRANGVEAKSARISLAYGPGTRVGDKRVMHAFIERALREKTLHLLDEGLAKRTYCYVSDIVNMMWRILLEGKDAIYNVGGISTTTIADLAQIISKQLNVPVCIPSETNTGILGAPDDVRLDLTKFINEFGPVSFVDFQSGVKRTIDWQASNLM
jgi:dTDP-glucose 4,6-dehydratase/UDP-glucuronate decarboxylase